MTISAPWEGLSLLDLIAAHAGNQERVALTFGDQQCSYAELAARARSLSGSLLSLGLRPGERVALLARNRIEYFEVELGVTHAGGVLVAMSWRYSPEERLSALQRSGVAVALVDEDFAPSIDASRRAGDLPELRAVVVFGDDYERLLGEPARPSAPARSLTDAHEIIFTSGTTGMPKGAVWTNGSVIWNAIQQTIDFGIDGSSSTFVSFDLNYIGGRHQLVWAILQRGGSVHLKSSGGFDPREVVTAIERHRVTHILLVPTMLRDVLDSDAVSGVDTSTLQMIMCGGSPVSSELLNDAHIAFPTSSVVQVYGLTEGGGSISHVPRPDVGRKLGSAGRASTHARIRIVDETGNVLPVRDIGEIEVHAPTLCSGYWRDPEATAALFHGGWLRTGDLGLLDDEGFLFVTGRKKELIISGGMNIFPREVEAVLERHPSVRASAVFGMPDERWGECVCAAVELYAGWTATADELIELCRSALSSYKRPTRITFVDELPRTVSGKIAKSELREQLGDL